MRDAWVLTPIAVVVALVVWLGWRAHQPVEPVPTPAEPEVVAVATPAAAAHDNTTAEEATAPAEPAAVPIAAIN